LRITGEYTARNVKTDLNIVSYVHIFFYVLSYLLFVLDDNVEMFAKLHM